MKCPVTKSLVQYLQELNCDLSTIIKRGMSKDALYRLMRHEVDFISAENTEKLANALRITPQELLSIALQREMETRESSATYTVIPHDLHPLIRAWPRLCEEQKARILGYVQAILDDQKIHSENMDQKTA